MESISSKTRIQRQIDRQRELIARIESSITAAPESQSANQQVSLQLLQAELAGLEQLLAAQTV